jgi:hypothetical protein
VSAQPGRAWAADATFGSFAAVFATLHFLGRTGGHLEIGADYSDSAVLAELVTARMHPELFVGDAFLGDPSLGAFYDTLYTRIIALLAALFGTPAEVIVALGLPVGFLYLVGYYLLGRRLVGDPLWAGLFAFTCAGMGVVLPGEYWGLFGEAEPRLVYAALLPFVLAGALAWLDRPARWPWLMLALAALLYLHPVSGPTVGLAVWSGLLAAKPSAETWRRHAVRMVWFGLMFLAMLAPFAFHYLASVRAEPWSDYAGLKQAALDRFGPIPLHALLALGEFAARQAPYAPLWLAALAGAIYLARRHGFDARQRFMAAFFVVILVASVGVALIDQTIAAALERFPLQVDVVRGLRYLPLFVPLYCFWALAGMAESGRIKREVAAALLASVGLLWLVGHRDPITYAMRGARCALLGGEACPSSLAAVDRDLLQAVGSQTAVGQLIYTNESRLGLAVRHSVRRPVTTLYRDGGQLFYGHTKDLPAWQAVMTQIAAADRQDDISERIAQHVALARRLGASHALLWLSGAVSNPQARNRALFANERGLLLAVPPE